MAHRCYYCGSREGNPGAGIPCASCWEVTSRLDAFLRLPKGRRYVLDKLRWMAVAATVLVLILSTWCSGCYGTHAQDLRCQGDIPVEVWRACPHTFQGLPQGGRASACFIRLRAIQEAVNRSRELGVCLPEVDLPPLPGPDGRVTWCPRADGLAHRELVRATDTEEGLLEALYLDPCGPGF